MRYAGDITRPGSNSELHAVDERIVGPMPESLDFAQAASLPLTASTAWELLFDRLRAHAADPAGDNALLVIGAAGGVGSILTQLARELTGMTVIGTASRAETNQSDAYVPQIAAVLRPEGQFALIDDPVDLDIGPFKAKSISIRWELMFTRAMFTTGTMARQHALLRRMAQLVDRGVLKHTLARRLDGIDAASLIQAHALVEAGTMIGKVVVARP